MCVYVCASSSYDISHIACHNSHRSKYVFPETCPTSRCSAGDNELLLSLNSRRLAQRWLFLERSPVIGPFPLQTTELKLFLYLHSTTSSTDLHYHGRTRWHMAPNSFILSKLTFADPHRSSIPVGLTVPGGKRPNLGPGLEYLRHSV